MRNDDITKAVYEGNGVTTRWSIPFDYFAESEIHVLLTVTAAGLEQETEVDSDSFTIDGDAKEIVYPNSAGEEPVPAGTKLTVYRSTDTLQQADYTNQGAMWPETLEGSLDKIHQVLQEHSEGLARSFTVSMSSNKTPKEYADELIAGSIAAVEAASAAAQSETNAATSATSAAGSAAAALASQQAAATSETNAAASAAAAAQSATDLESAVQQAAASASAAAGSASAAATSENNAAASASAALTSQQAAANSVTAAAASATAAAGSATAAAGSATAAESHANAAEYYTHIVTGFPVGTRISWLSGGTTPPNGFLICNGDAVSRTYYADLFAAIGTQYGPGDGETTFNLPNLTDEVTGGRYIIKAFDVESSGSAAEAAARAALSASNAAASATNAATGATSATQSATSAAESATQAANTAASINYHAGYRQPSTAYNTNAMATHSALPYGWFLLATTDGVTDSADLVITTPAIGDTVTDGTVTWEINQIGAGGGGGMIHTEIITTSGTWTAPATGGYKFILLSGGGGGGGGSYQYNFSGGGGASGAAKTVYINLTEGDVVQIVIGAGGKGSSSANYAPTGGAGGTTSITYNETTYSIAGGAGGQGGQGWSGGGYNGAAGAGVRRNDIWETDTIGGSGTSGGHQTTKMFGVNGGGGAAQKNVGSNGQDGFVLIQYLAGEEQE